MKQITCTLTFLLILVFTNALKASENTVDSLRIEIKKAKSETAKIDLMNQIADVFASRNIKACLEMCDSALVLSEKVGYKNGTIDALQTKGFVYAVSGQYDKSFDVLERALEYLESAPDERRRGAVIYALGIARLESGDFETAESHFLETHAIKKKRNDPEEIIKSFNSLSNLYRSVGNYEKTFEMLNQALELVDEVNSNELKLLPYLGLGVLYSAQGDHSKALEYQLKAEKLSETITDPDSRGKVLFSIGGSYTRLNEYEKALDYYQRSYGIIKGIGQNNLTGITLRELAMVNSKLGNYSKVPALLREALTFYQNGNKDCSSIHVYSSLGKHYLGTNQLDSANYFAEKAMQRAESCPDPYQKIVALKAKASWHVHQNDNREAIELYSKAYEKAEKRNLLNLMSGLAEKLSALHEKEKEYLEALKFHRIFQTTKDSIFNKDNTQKITRLESQYQYEKEKEVMLAEQEKQELVLQQEIERQRIIQVSAVGGALLLLILAVNFYRSYKAKKKDHQLLTERNKKIESQAGELQKTNDQLIELSSFKEGLTHMIAHDMKNPLNVIIGLSEASKKDRQLNDINESGKRMLNMVTNMLDIQRFEQAEVELHAEEVSLKDLLQSATHQVELLAHAKAIEIMMDFPSSTNVSGNGDMIIRVLVNLLSNAIKYSDFDSKIFVDATLESGREGFVMISVRDQGEGISSEELPHIFEKFWQVRAKASGTIKSTGLGLTYCKMAIEAHGGEIKVTSARAEGTTFFFDVPLSINLNGGIADRVKKLSQADNQPVILEGELISLQSYASHLKKLKVYQASEINNIIEQMDKQELQSIWKEELKMAVYECNTDKFNDLVSMI